MKCQITDFVEDHLCGYLWHFLVVCLCSWQTTCCLQPDTWNYLTIAHWTKPTLETYLCGLYTIHVSAKLVIFTPIAHVFQVLSAVSHMRGTFNGNRPVNKLSTCKDDNIAAFFSFVTFLGKCSTIHSPPVLFLKWRLACANQFHFLHPVQSMVAQPAETTVVKCSLVGCVRGSHTLPGQPHSQPTPTSMGQGCMCV